MNIFASSTCPVESAKFLDDKRCTKMVLESAQLLSAALLLNGYTGSDVYKISHRNHPSSVWARKTRGNYKWLLAHFKALCEEYTSRYGKIHKSSQLLPIFQDNIDLIPEGELMPFSNNARNLEKGVDFTNVLDTCDAYKLYLASRWETDKREPTWS